MFCALDVIDNIAEDAEGTVFDVRTATGVQHWRYTITDSAVLARTEHLTAVLAVTAPARIDRRWVLEFLLDRGIDGTGLEPAGLNAAADTCAQCGDVLAWCGHWVRARLSAGRDL